MRRKTSSGGIIGAAIVLLGVWFAVRMFEKYWPYIIGVGAALLLWIVIHVVRKRRARDEYMSLPVIYVGNSATRTFHRPNCRTINGLNNTHGVPFRYRDEALRAGYTPCGICKP